eukprot:TRINITY_DN23558_c0_g1_i2.p4 TRINITY_DN23558_c0_g1~~TRINITY_DN23558_c0_g1_i2.p4  ORF type:complete len:132 (+),score=14.07 TRINITY_DN23558_c0_g1_i2:290-685(+)
MVVKALDTAVAEYTVANSRGQKAFADFAEIACSMREYKLVQFATPLRNYVPRIQAHCHKIQSQACNSQYCVEPKLILVEIRYRCGYKKTTKISKQIPVSYTHLTLPTILLVQISVVALSLKKKNDEDRQGS